MYKRGAVLNRCDQIEELYMEGSQGKAFSQYNAWPTYTANISFLTTVWPLAKCMTPNLKQLMILKFHCAKLACKELFKLAHLSDL